ncbi:unnamed protein product [Closterium sp. Yama58-4]|nr:unnamed protein product [Closterium sp. Yama58-4]
MLKPAEHQVAGHRFEEGRQGSLVDDSGCFYKPMQAGERGEKELKFYTRIAADTSIPPEIKAMFPVCHGSKEFLVMEDLTRNYTKPCIMDIKMGRKTWYEGAPQKYIDKCLVKDSTTTSGTLGYRVAGMQVQDSRTGAMWRAGRKWCQNLTNQQMPAVFRLFFSPTPTADAPGIDAIAPAGFGDAAGAADAAAVVLNAEAKQRMRGILCGEGGLLAQLQTLRNCAEAKQRMRGILCGEGGLLAQLQTLRNCAEAKQRMRGILCGEGGLLAQLQTLRNCNLHLKNFSPRLPFYPSSPLARMATAALMLPLPLSHLHSFPSLLLHRFAQQTSFHFFSASILLIYEANTPKHAEEKTMEFLGASKLTHGYCCFPTPHRFAQQTSFHFFSASILLITSPPLLL